MVRHQRLAELSTLQQTSIHNQVYPLQKPDYSRDVTEASSKFYVLVNLTSSLGTNIESQILTELWRQLAAKYGDVKFCEMRADLCIEGYPEKNAPTILVYKDREIKKQMVTLRELGGTKTHLAGTCMAASAAVPSLRAAWLIGRRLDLETLLVDVGAVKENDVRLRKNKDDQVRNSHTARGETDDDEDWD